MLRWWKEICKEIIKNYNVSLFFSRIWYQKNTPTANKGCSIDLVTKNIEQISLKFGIWHKNGSIAESLPENM